MCCSSGSTEKTYHTTSNRRGVAVHLLFAFGFGIVWFFELGYIYFLPHIFFEYIPVSTEYNLP